MNRALSAGVVAAAVFLTACGTSINSDIRVADGEKRSGSLSTVNGRILLGAESEVDGRCRTVNGGIRAEAGSSVGGLATVNGSIHGGERVIVSGDVETVNGSISLEADSRVDGEITTINGAIDLERTTVAGDLRTVHGNIELREGATIKGNLVFERKLGASWSQGNPLRVEIADGSVIEGDLIVEDRDLKVEVVLRSGGRVLGQIENAQVIEDVAAAEAEAEPI
jgi:DUF4097 and DUF4098 domain-containing protein YvlB